MAWAIEVEEQRHALAVEVGADGSIGSSLNNQGASHHADGELEQAIDLYRQALCFTDTSSADLAAANLTVALVDAHRLSEADRLMATVRERQHGLDAHDTVNLARIRAEQGALREAADLLQECVDENRAIGGVAFCDCLRVTSRLAGLTAQPEAAARLLGAADSTDLHPGWPFTRGDRARATPPAEQALGPERFQQLYAGGQELTPEQASSLGHAVTANVLAGTPAADDQHLNT